jgi:hypothetical protein
MFMAILCLECLYSKVAVLAALRSLVLGVGNPVIPGDAVLLPLLLTFKNLRMEHPHPD